MKLAGPIETKGAAPLVLVVEDDDSLRQSIQQMLASVRVSCKGFRCCAEFLAAPPYIGPGCLVLDLRLPGLGGLDILSRVRSSVEHLPVIVITGFADVRTAVRAMKLGADELFEKPFSPQEFLDAIMRCLEISTRRWERVCRTRLVIERLDGLTPREQEMVDLILEGFSTKEIASRLRISPKTAENHRLRMMEKMGARGAAHLAAMVTEARLSRVEVPPVS